MSSETLPARKRERFSDAADPAQGRLLNLLLAQDGSTTRLCEAVAGGPIELHLIGQKVTGDVPETVRQQLPGTLFMERITSIAAHGAVLMDNLSYISLAGLAPDIEADLRAGQLPIGHLLARLWVRREPLAHAPVLATRLWEAVGLPDPAATRAYKIVSREAALMVIVETYRRGMLMPPPSATRAGGSGASAIAPANAPSMPRA
jgi:chorismate-pyruvate lyase